MSQTFSNESLPVNVAGLEIINNSSSFLDLWGQALDCFLCDLIKLTSLNETETFWKFDSNTKWNLELRNNTNSILCKENNVQFGEHGIYFWNYNGSCLPISVEVAPQDPFIPVYYFEGILFVYFCIKFYVRRRCVENRPVFTNRNESVPSESENNVSSPDEAAELIRSSSNTRIQEDKEEKTKRVRSLDVFRGYAILLMIFVNYGGGKYWFFEHSPWNGVTIADVVFPCFAWIMGVGIALKVKCELRNSMPKSSLIYKLFNRSLIMVILGVILTNLKNDNLRTIRIPGVLQRLGISYFIVALLEVLFMKPQPELQNDRYRLFEDFVESWKQWVLVLVGIFVHTYITFYLPVPNCPTGYLGPGGLHNHSSVYNCTGGAAGYIDRLIFTEKHLYSRPTCQKYYGCQIPYDPEGLLGVLTTVLCIYMGVHAGRILLVFKSANERLIRWFLWSIFTMVSALLLCNFSVNEGFIPLNKNLWSLSYVLFCSSLAFIFQTLIYYITDKKKWLRGFHACMVGMNAILLYVGHIVCQNTFPWQWTPFNTSTHTEYFFMNTWATILWIFAAVWLGKRKLFITI